MQTVITLALFATAHAAPGPIVAPNFWGFVRNVELDGTETAFANPFVSSPHDHGLSITDVAYNADADETYAAIMYTGEIKAIDAAGADRFLATNDCGCGFGGQLAAHRGLFYAHETGELLSATGNHPAATDTDYLYAIDPVDGSTVELFASDDHVLLRPKMLHGDANTVYFVDGEDDPFGWEGNGTLSSLDLLTGVVTAHYDGDGAGVSAYSRRADAPGWIAALGNGDVVTLDEDFGGASVLARFDDLGEPSAYLYGFQAIAPSPDGDGYVLVSDFSDLVLLGTDGTLAVLTDGDRLSGEDDRTMLGVTTTTGPDDDGDGLIHWFFGGNDRCPSDGDALRDLDGDGCADPSGVLAEVDEAGRVTLSLWGLPPLAEMAFLSESSSDGPRLFRPVRADDAGEWERTFPAAGVDSIQIWVDDGVWSDLGEVVLP